MTSASRSCRSMVVLMTLVAGILCWAGCETEQQNPAISDVGPLSGTEITSIGIPSLATQGDTNVMTFQVEFDGVMRQVELRASDAEWSATIFDGDTPAYEMHWLIDGTGWEATPFERLDIAIQTPHEAEFYKYTNLLSGSADMLRVTTATTEEEWVSFFDPFSLNNNAEGNRLAKVLTSPHVLTTLTPYCDPGRVDKKPTPTERLCGVASTLGSLKCMLGGGVMNPLCHVAVGVIFCCGVMYLVGGDL